MIIKLSFTLTIKACFERVVRKPLSFNINCTKPLELLIPVFRKQGCIQTRKKTLLFFAILKFKFNASKWK